MIRAPLDELRSIVTADEERPNVPMPARIGGSGIDDPRVMGTRRW